MLHYYQIEGFSALSHQKHGFPPLTEDEVQNSSGPLLYLTERDPEHSQVCFAASELKHLRLDKESLLFLQQDPDPQEAEGVSTKTFPDWIKERIASRKIYVVNTRHPRWLERVKQLGHLGGRIHIVGLGDVGSTLLMGMRILGKGIVEKIGIYDLAKDKIARYEHEINQIASLDYQDFPRVEPITEEALFDCDVFVFCVARQIPDIKEQVQDVRLAQLEANAEIIKTYAHKARSVNFNGLFAVVSDPVDHLCQVVYRESNRSSDGGFDYRGLFPEMIKGFGLGVMNARANYYARQYQEVEHYLSEGRAFGPHGQGLVIANSIQRYDDSLSNWLTDQTVTANLKVREIGYKPYIAPAMSSGVYSILNTLSGHWNYSTVFLGGVYLGCRNMTDGTVPYWETYDFPNLLWQRLHETYHRLETFNW